MYAVIVTAGDIIEVEKLEANAGDTLKLDTVLSVSGDKIMVGTPHVAGALVEAQVLGQVKADKVLIFKKKRRHNYKRKNGHRQQHTVLHILSVSLNGTALATKEPRKLLVAKTAPAPKAKTLARMEKASAANAKPAAVKKPVAKKAAAPAAKKPAAKKAAK